MKNPETIRLLQMSFSTKDWEYLHQNSIFKELLSKPNPTLDDFETLVENGGLLLRQREEVKGCIPL
ncbi:MAG TPA: hypothetical protein VN761_09230 [Candidatus Polarisedimenticolia bacterium]|nr:hypothetical protein [Candidatus Polarisedimenticolia bacterium]